MNKPTKPKDENAVALRTGARVFSGLQREIDHLFEDVRKGFEDLTTMDIQPAIDVSETAAELKICAELPGLTPKDVDVRVEGDALVISGEKSNTREKSGERFRMMERTYGAFTRTVGLPPGVEAAKMKATMADGVLTVTVPRPPTPDHQRIEIKAG